MKESKKTYTIVLAVFLTVSAYFLADTADALIGRSLEASPHFTAPMERGRAESGRLRELSDYSSILERGLFGEGQAPSSTPVVETTNYKLIGTVQGSSFSGAVLEDTTGQSFYRLREKLPDGSQIIKVGRERVTIKKAAGGITELQIFDDTKIVNMPKPITPAAGVRRVGEGKFMVDQQEVVASTENLSQLLTQARALPYTEQGKIVGFRISEIVPGSIYEKLGLRNVIQKINAQYVDDPAKFFQMYQNLKEERNVTIDLIRGGQRQTQNYEIR
jgi:general secretion pathway protein C